MAQNLLTDTSSDLIMVAGANTAVNDLVFNTESGLVYPASANLSPALINNITAGLSAIEPFTLVGNNNFGVGSTFISSRMVLFDNGPLVTIHTGTGSSSTNPINIRFRNLQAGGADIGAITLSTPVVSSNESNYRILRLSSTSFVVAWTSSSGSGNIGYAIYSTSRSTIRGETAITDRNNSIRDFAIGVLTNGNFVILYADSSQIVFRRYDSTGTEIGTKTSVTSFNVGMSNASVLAHSSGDFYLYWNDNNTFYFRRYNSSGTAQAAVQNMVGGGPFLTGAIDNNVAIELSNGNVLFLVNSGTSPALPQARVYSTETLLGTVDLSFNNDVTSYVPSMPPGVCATPSGFAVLNIPSALAGVATPSRVFSTFDFSCNPIITRKTLSGVGTGLDPQVTSLGSTASSTITGCRLFLTNGNFVALDITSNNTVGKASTYAFDLNGAIGSVVTLSSVNSSLITDASYLVAPDGTAFMQMSRKTAQPGLLFGAYNSQRKSILGVARERANTGQRLRIETTGTFTTNQNFSRGGAFDQRTAAVFGTRGFISSNTVTLLGLS